MRSSRKSSIIFRKFREFSLHAWRGADYRHSTLNRIKFCMYSYSFYYALQLLLNFGKQKNHLVLDLGSSEVSLPAVAQFRVIVENHCYRVTMGSCRFVLASWIISLDVISSSKAHQHRINLRFHDILEFC